MTKTAATPGFLLLLAAVASLLLALIIAPFAGSLFAAAVLAGVLFPGQIWLQSRLGERPALAAGVLSLGVSALVVAPLAGLSVFVARQVTEFYSDVTSILERRGVDGLVEEIPAPIREFGASVLGAIFPEHGDATGSPEPSPSDDGDEALQLTGEGLETAANVATHFVDSLFGLLIDLAVLVVALFFLLSQGSALVRWIVDALPLPRPQATRLVEEFRDVTRAVFTATVVTALVQTVVAAVGFWIAAVPHLPVALLATFVAALVPVVGGAVVVCGIGVLMMLYGHVGMGVFLVVWGVAPVGVCDNLVKPWLARQKLRLPGSVVLFAMLGGVAVFGPMGIVAGPLIVAFFLASLRLLRQEGLVPS